MIKKGKDLLNNTHDEVALFGGDLSWQEDYFNEIKMLLDASKIVKVFIPKSKLNVANRSAREELIRRIEVLNDMGALIYITKEDSHMRGFIVDPNNSNNRKTTIFFAVRVKTNSKNKAEINIVFKNSLLIQIKRCVQLLLVCIIKLSKMLYFITIL